LARDTLVKLGREVVACGRCPRLRRWCQDVAKTKVRRFRDETYWGRPTPGFGDPTARLLIVGLAPAAHGANRTGRVFTGDRSGDFLYAALHRAGFANQAAAVSRADGLLLKDCYITPIVRCAPPANKPTTEETANCREYLSREWTLLGNVRAVLALGKLAQDGLIAALRAIDIVFERRAYAFGHGVSHDIGNGVQLFASYHPSQQNTFTGRLTPRMLDAVLRDIRQHLRRRSA